MFRYEPVNDFEKQLPKIRDLAQNNSLHHQEQLAFYYNSGRMFSTRSRINNRKHQDWYEAYKWASRAKKNGSLDKTIDELQTVPWYQIQRPSPADFQDYSSKNLFAEKYLRNGERNNQGGKRINTNEEVSLFEQGGYDRLNRIEDGRWSKELSARLVPFINSPKAALAWFVGQRKKPIKEVYILTHKSEDFIIWQGQTPVGGGVDEFYQGPCENILSWALLNDRLALSYIMAKHYKGTKQFDWLGKKDNNEIRPLMLAWLRYGAQQAVDDLYRALCVEQYEDDGRLTPLTELLVDYIENNNTNAYYLAMYLLKKHFVNPNYHMGISFWKKSIFKQNITDGDTALHVLAWRGMKNPDRAEKAIRLVRRYGGRNLPRSSEDQTRPSDLLSTEKCRNAYGEYRASSLMFGNL